MNKNKKIMLETLIILLIMIGVFVIYQVMNKSDTHTPIVTKTNNDKNENKNNEEDDKMESINVIIDNKKYIAEVEDNETVKSFIDYLPQEFKMKELNGNEKYIYMNKSLPTNSIYPKQIQKGDIMLYGDDCLVIFYQTFDTSYSYTKIGHIDNLPDLGTGTITVKFEK